MLPHDLHVLSLQLAFILSQDQTLHCIFFYLYQIVQITQIIQICYLSQNALVSYIRQSLNGLKLHLFNYSLTAHFSFTQNTNYKSQCSTSCTTTSLFYVILSKNSSSLAHASKKTRKRMQRYDFFLNYQIFLRKFFIKTRKKFE